MPCHASAPRRRPRPTQANKAPQKPGKPPQRAIRERFAVFIEALPNPATSRHSPPPRYSICQWLRWESNPHDPCGSGDFKSPASASSATEPPWIWMLPMFQRGEKGAIKKAAGEGGLFCQSGWGDLNPRPPDPQSGALTKLRYTPSIGQVLHYNAARGLCRSAGFGGSLESRFWRSAETAGRGWAARRAWAGVHPCDGQAVRRGRWTGRFR